MTEHEAVFAREAIEQLNIVKDGIYVDCTFGRGGHSEKILQHLSGNGHLYAFDQDEAAAQHAHRNFHHYKNFTFIKNNFRFLEDELSRHKIKEIDGVLFDLGVSSPQLDEIERGFSYHEDAPLDMRMDQRAQLSAYEVVNDWDYGQLVSIFFRYGEERFSKQIARKIETARNKQKIRTTTELVNIIKDAIPAPARRTGGHPARRVFQAIRIAVNDELKAFEDGLERAINIARKGARIVVITFHSLEDRICKTTFRQESKGPELPRGLPVISDDYLPNLKIITRRPIVPTEEEIERNRRARSAKLRVAEKL